MGLNSYPETMMKQWIKKLEALPMRYFCNYCLLGCLGIGFELLVWGIRSGKIEISAFWQFITVTAMLVTILQTAAEYFRPDGVGDFWPRAAAASLHVILFSSLIILQLTLEIPFLALGCFISILLLTLVLYEILFKGKGNQFLLPILFCAFSLVLYLQNGAPQWIIAPKTIITGHVLLVIFIFFAWNRRSRRKNRKD